MLTLEGAEEGELVLSLTFFYFIYAYADFVFCCSE